jgi:hypothetical protein
MTPGPWGGSVAYINEEGGACVDRQEEMGQRGRELSWIWWCLDHKDLERGRGFLIYLSRTYPPVTPFFLGLKQNIDGWRHHRHEYGWKMQQAEIWAAQGDEDEAEVEDDFLNIHGNDDPPLLVEAAARLEGDMEVLQMLTSSEPPPRTQNMS